MRAFCTVSAPLEVCAPPARPLSPGARFLALRLLGHTAQPQTLYFLVEAKSRVREVYAQTCLHFAKQGMLDTELFGLAVVSGKLLAASEQIWESLNWAMRRLAFVSTVGVSVDG